MRLRIDRDSGQRVSGGPSNTMLEYFLEEFLPAEADQQQTPIGTDDLKGLF